MIHSIARGSQAFLFIVIGVSGDTRNGVDGSEVLGGFKVLGFNRSDSLGQVIRTVLDGHNERKELGERYKRSV